MSHLFQTHIGRLERAVDALRSRTAFSPFTESPSGRLHPLGAHARGRAAFQARLGRPFAALDLPGQAGWLGDERSPYRDRKLAQTEHFGPVAFLICAGTRADALRCATADAAKFGAIASYVYSTDVRWLLEVEEAFALAGASVGINLIGQRPMNFTAAFSDYHVTGLNPAGNACLTDAAFVSRRFDSGSSRASGSCLSNR